MNWAEKFSIMWGVLLMLNGIVIGFDLWAYELPIRHTLNAIAFGMCLQYFFILG